MATAETIRNVEGAGVAALRVAVEELGSHLATLEAELSEGRSIEVVRGETVIAEVRAPRAAEAAEPLEASAEAERAPLPDFKARLRELWGDKVFPSGTGVKLIREDRDARG